MADSKISALTSGGGFQAGDFFPIDRSAANFKVTPIGVPVLVYRYTVTGSDKASIDTGVDTADAGSNDWTGGDLLEVWMTLRTDDAAGQVNTVAVTVNNNTSSIYDEQFVYGLAGTPTAGTSLATANWDLDVHGSGGTTAYPSTHCIIIPDYAGTTFNTVGTLQEQRIDATASNAIALYSAIGWRNTAALTRLKVGCTSTNKLKVGSQLLIYKRLSS